MLLEEQYNTPQSYDCVIQMLRDLKWDTVQPLRHYAIDIKCILDGSRLTTRERDQLACHYFIEGLRPAQRVHDYVVKKDPRKTNIGEALELALQYVRNHSSSVVKKRSVATSTDADVSTLDASESSVETAFRAEQVMSNTK